MRSAPTEIKMKIVIDTSELVAATARMKEYIFLKSLAGFDTTADLDAMTAIIKEVVGAEANLSQASDGGERGARGLFADEDDGWERLCPADSGPLR